MSTKLQPTVRYSDAVILARIRVKCALTDLIPIQGSLRHALQANPNGMEILHQEMKVREELEKLKKMLEEA